MTETTQDPPSNVVPILKAIEGGRNIAANNVCSEFAKSTEELSVDAGLMAGFAVVVWDDEGQMSCAVHIGARTPFSPMQLLGFASDMIRSKVLTDVQ